MFVKILRIYWKILDYFGWFILWETMSTYSYHSFISRPNPSYWKDMKKERSKWCENTSWRNICRKDNRIEKQASLLHTHTKKIQKGSWDNINLNANNGVKLFMPKLTDACLVEKALSSKGISLTVLGRRYPRRLMCTKMIQLLHEKINQK